MRAITHSGRWRVVALALLLNGASWAQTSVPVFSPDVALCLQHLRKGERERAEKALGPLDQLPIYRVEITVDPSSDNVQGKLQLDQWVDSKPGSRPISELYLQMTPNAQESGRVRLSALSVNGQPADYSNYDATMVRIAVSPAAPPGTWLHLTANFRAHVPKVVNNPMGGMDLSSGKKEHTDYGAFGVMGKFYSLVGVIPRTPPLHADGSPHDGPSGMGDLALYEPAHLVLNVHVPQGYEVEATGISLGRTPDGKGSVLYTYAAAAARDFPLFISHGYQIEELKQGDVTLSIHFNPEHAEAAERVLMYASSALTEMEKRLGKQPFNQFRVVEASLQSGAGGMEFPGLISIASGLMSGGVGMLESMGISKDQLPMMKDIIGSTSSLEATIDNILEFTVAHEVGHQYFAELVGSDPITEPAVDESLTQFTALLYLEWRYGKEGYDSMRNGQLTGSYHLYRMMGGADGAVDRPTSAFGSGIEYAALVYGKGPLLYEAQRNLIGNDAFMKGMRHYVDQYRFRWACRDCFTQLLSRENPSHASELRALRHRWWDEAHGDEDMGGLEGMVDGLKGVMPGLDPKTQGLVDEFLKSLE